MYNNNDKNNKNNDNNKNNNNNNIHTISSCPNTKILCNFKIVKKLGSGMIGMVYKISSPNLNSNLNPNLNLSSSPTITHALKIEHVEKKDLVENSKSKVWREINFYLDIGHKYPNQFVQMIEYDFVSNCSHIQTYSFDPKLFDLKFQAKLKKLAESKYCVRKVYELVDGNLTRLLPKLNKNQIYSMMVQLSWSIKILHSNGYTHGDLHSDNIGYTHTKLKFVQLGDLKIKTFGYIFKLMDFGDVMYIKKCCECDGTKTI